LINLLERVSQQTQKKTTVKVCLTSMYHQYIDKVFFLFCAVWKKTSFLRWWEWLTTNALINTCLCKYQFYNFTNLSGKSKVFSRYFCSKLKPHIKKIYFMWLENFTWWSSSSQLNLNVCIYQFWFSRYFVILSRQFRFQKSIHLAFACLFTAIRKHFLHYFEFESNNVY